MNLAAVIFSAATLLAAQFATATESPSAPTVTEVSGDIRLFRSQYFHLKSGLNGRVYRIMIAVPKSPAPAASAPTLYVLDGNQYFETAATAAARYAYGGDIVSPVVVGIGYATDNVPEILAERAFDLTPSLPIDPNLKGRFGGGSVFAQVLETEIIPFVRSRFGPDLKRQAIWGHSHGGLFVMASLLRNPTQFSHYILSSPSIWWNDREVLKSQDSFVRLLDTRTTQVSVLVTSASDEQYRGNDLARLSADSRMVDNASDFAKWLDNLKSSSVKVQRTIFEDEGHGSAAPVSVNRAVRFAFRK